MRVAMLVVLLVSAASARLASVPFKLNDKGLTGFIAEAYGSRIAVDPYGVLRITGGNRMYLVDDYWLQRDDWSQVRYRRIEPLDTTLPFQVAATFYPDGTVTIDLSQTEVRVRFYDSERTGKVGEELKRDEQVAKSRPAALSALTALRGVDV